MSSDLTWDLLGWVDEFPDGPVREKLVEKVREDGGGRLVDAWQGGGGRTSLLGLAAERPDLLPGGGS